MWYDLQGCFKGVYGTWKHGLLSLILIMEELGYFKLCMRVEGTGTPSFRSRAKYINPELPACLAWTHWVCFNTFLEVLDLVCTCLTAGCRYPMDMWYFWTYGNLWWKHCTHCLCVWILYSRCTIPLDFLSKIGV